MTVALEPSGRVSGPHLRVLDGADLPCEGASLVLSIPTGTPPAIQHLARRVVESLDELLVAAAPAGAPTAEQPLTGPAIGVDHLSRAVRLDGREIRLTRLEFELIAYLDRHAHRAVTREELLNAVWRQAPEFGSRTVDVHVRRVRRKLGASFRLTTVRGYGYRFEGWPTTP